MHGFNSSKISAIADTVISEHINADAIPVAQAKFDLPQSLVMFNLGVKRKKDQQLALNFYN
jgi:hypothetical protein